MPDESYIEQIAEFLKQVKPFFEKQQQNKALAENEKVLASKSLNLIDILLRKESVNDERRFSRIRILRQPVKKGPLTESQGLMANKKEIERLIYDRLKYTDRSLEGFTCSIADKSLNYTAVS